MPSPGFKGRGRLRRTNRSSFTLQQALTHAPLHAPEDWIDKFKGEFDQGWDKVRKETLAQQKKMGMVPENTKLTPRPKEISAWDELSDDAKRLYARHQETFAGFLAAYRLSHRTTRGRRARTSGWRQQIDYLCSG